jgi:hypothetical protein
MRILRFTLAAAALAASASIAFSPSAAADNCDIFINPEDCQNTGWTVGVVATLAGGVAVAIAVTSAGVHRPAPEHREPPPVPAPTSLGLRPPGRPPREDRDEIDGVEIRPEYDPPAVTAEPRSGTGRTHSVRLEINIDRGTQTAQEVRRGPR